MERTLVTPRYFKRCTGPTGDFNEHTSSFSQLKELEDAYERRIRCDPSSPDTYDLYRKVRDVQQLHMRELAGKGSEQLYIMWGPGDRRTREREVIEHRRDPNIPDFQRRTSQYEREILRGHVE